MRRFKARLAKLEQTIGAGTCSACNRQVTMHVEYPQPDGTWLCVPPIPDCPPCTCPPGFRGKEPLVTSIIIRGPRVYEREENDHFVEEADKAPIPETNIEESNNGIR